ncbi:hypothetical protein FXO37_13831 [Capsicum annuum]|nr:hypothetical protein FXO37_13831 [Capsicum annuum]
MNKKKDEHNEAGCTEDLTIHQSPQMKHLEDEHNDAKKEGCTEELSRRHNPHMKHLEDVLMSDKEEASIEDLEKEHSPVMFTPDFPDAQVKELEVAKSREVKHTSPVKRDKKKSKTFRSPYITKFGSSSKDEGSSDNEEKHRYAFDGCTIYEDLPNQLISDYSQWLELGLLKYHSLKKQTDNHYLKNAPELGYPLLDFIVAQALSKNWFYLMTQPKMCWNDEHLDVIFYHLRKKSKLQQYDTYRYTTTSCFFKTYMEKTYERYFSAVKTEHISMQEDYAESVACASNEIAITNIINGFCISADLPWYLVDEVYVLVHCGKEYHWVLTVVVLKERTIRIYDSLSRKKKSELPTEIRKLAAMLPTYLSDSDFFEKTERIDWSTLKAYEGKLGLQIGDISHNPFDVK